MFEYKEIKSSALSQNIQVVDCVVHTTCCICRQDIHSQAVLTQSCLRFSRAHVNYSHKIKHWKYLHQTVTEKKQMTEDTFRQPQNCNCFILLHISPIELPDYAWSISLLQQHHVSTFPSACNNKPRHVWEQKPHESILCRFST